MYKVKRYQVYLNPHSVSIIDEIEKNTEISRSKIIRDGIDRYANSLAKVFKTSKIPPTKKTVLDSLAGSISIKGKKRTNFASRVDEIYLSD